MFGAALVVCVHVEFYYTVLSSEDTSRKRTQQVFTISSIVKVVSFRFITTENSRKIHKGEHENSLSALSAVALRMWFVFLRIVIR